jgi:hypothetical protein
LKLEDASLELDVDTVGFLDDVVLLAYHHLLELLVMALHEAADASLLVALLVPPLL